MLGCYFVAAEVLSSVCGSWVLLFTLMSYSIDVFL